MRKAVPVALVLIAGATVVLWFGNRLNSWVLGGLIGGLASLLLSIPISLALFSYFARQHDEREQYTEVLRKRLLSRRSTSLRHYLPDEIDAGYYDDEYAVVDGEISAIVEEDYQSPTARRNSDWSDEEFEAPISPARQLPPAASSRHTTRNVSARPLHGTSGTQQGKTTPPSRREQDYKGRRTTARRTIYPGLPSSQQASFRSRFHSRALHTARLEAAQQYIEENDVSLEDPGGPPISPVARSRRTREIQRDHLLPDAFSGDIHKPLVRRAPYTYEDDELGQEMSRYTEPPPVRRATRYLRAHKNEDQEQ